MPKGCDSLDPHRRARAWSFADMADRGAFCPIAAIEDQLYALCGELNLGGCGVLPVRGTTVFGTVALFVSAEASVEARSLSATRLVDEFEDHVGGSEKAQTSSSLAAALLAAENEGDAIDALRTGLPGLTIQRLLPAELPIRLVRAPREAVDADGLLLYFVAWGQARGPQTDEVRLPSPAQLETLRAYVACAAPVALNAIARADDRFRHLRSKAVPGRCPSDAPLDDLLELARVATGSDYGAVYFATREEDAGSWARRTSQLELAAQLEPSGSTEIRDKENQIPAVDSSTVAAAYRRSRAIQYDRVGLSDSPYLTPVFQDASTEIAVPIRRELIVEDILVGVLVLARGESSNESYTSADLQRLRLVAQRMASSNIDALLKETTRLFRELSQSPDRDALEETAADAGDLQQVPADYHFSLPALQSIADTLSRTTPSISVSVRLVTHDQRNSIRVCSAPLSRLTDSEHLIPLARRDSMVSWVLRNGVACYIRNIRNRSDFEAYPGLDGFLQSRGENGEPRETGSALCVPIVVDGQVVGTINCESPGRAGYDSVSHVVEALGTLAGLQLASLRRTYEQEVLALGTRLYGFSHSLKNVARSLRELAGEDDALREQADLIDQFVAAGRRRLYHSRVDEVTIRSVIEEAVAALEKSRPLAEVHVEFDDRIDALSYRRKAAVLGAARFAIGEVLRNAYTHSPMIGTTKPINLSATLHPGLGQDEGEVPVVEVRNRMSGASDIKVNELFRVPIRSGETRDDAHLHLGGFLAGMIMRAVHGDIVLRSSTEDGVVVQIILPSSQLAP